MSRLQANKLKENKQLAFVATKSYGKLQQLPCETHKHSEDRQARNRATHGGAAISCLCAATGHAVDGSGASGAPKPSHPQPLKAIIKAVDIEDVV